MNRVYDTVYFKRRAEQERMREAQAANSKAASIHAALASEYERRCMHPTPHDEQVIELVLRQG